MESEDTFQQFNPIHLRRYIYLFWRWLWLIALVTIVAGLAAFLVSTRQSRIYQASTTLLVNEAPANRTTDYNSLLASQTIARTYSQMLTTQPVLDETVKRLGLDFPTDSLKQQISVTPVRDTQLIQIAVESPSPQQAAQIANTLAEVFTEQVQAVQVSRFGASKDSLQKQMDDTNQRIQDLSAERARSVDPTTRQRLEDELTQYRQIYSSLLQSYEQVRLSEAQTVSSVSQVDPATEPLNPIRPKVFQNTLLALFGGLLLAVGGIFAVEALDDTIKQPEELMHRFGVPILGIVAFHKTEEGTPIAVKHPRSPISEAFRALRTNIQYINVNHPTQKILITSPTPSEGKSLIAANLAVVLAQGGTRVTVIDADLHRPTIHKVLGTANSEGLSTLFVDTPIHLNGSIQQTTTKNLGVLSSGKLPPNPSELLGSPKMVEIFQQIQEKSDVILIDTPPMLSVTDALVITPFVDGVVLVIVPGKTKLGAFTQAIEQLRQVNAKLLGVVVNAANSNYTQYSYYYRNIYPTSVTYIGQDGNPENGNVNHKAE